MKLRKVVTLATAGSLTAGMSLLGMGFSTAHAVTTAEQAVTFTVTPGSLALAQTPTAGTLLVQGTAQDMPVTTITDARNDTGRTAAWTVSATASNLVAGAATILSGEITLDESGTFSSGTGTPVNALPVVGTGTLVSATGNSIDSVYTYTPTAKLTAQSHPNSGAYTGSVTQTVA